jgi:cell wall-associated NlpC family hydrolase
MDRRRLASASPPLVLLLLAALLLPGAAALPSIAAAAVDPIAELLGQLRLQRLGYAIQVGAFAQVDNAVRLERRLAAIGIDAYYFRHESGLYKVRFGNHASAGAAHAEAARLRQQGLIGAFFIVAPQEYAVARAGTGNGDLRTELVATARRFLGVPYRWGGSDRDEGFDCSGLTMVCYRLSGLDLPRVSRSQFAAGRPVPVEELRPGDLVFFATHGGGEVSHVGLYLGGGRFIHAPRTGEKVQVQELAHPFYARTFVGGRSYL